MSDLANLVSACIRDKVVHDQQQEILHLQQENANLQERQRHSRRVAVTGPNGVPVYAQGELDRDGEQVGSQDGDCPRWYVELTQNPGATCTTLQEFLGLEVRVGDTGKKMISDRRGPNDEYDGLGYFVRHNSSNGLADVTLCGGPGLPILHGTLGPMSGDAFKHLDWEHGEFDLHESAEILKGVFENGKDQVTLLIEAVKFNNDLHTLWDIV